MSAVPNHQTGRVTPLATRAMVAFFGVFGYELDPTRLSDVERAEVGEQVAFYAGHREVLQRGRFLRLESPFEGDRDHVSWMAVSPDGGPQWSATYQLLRRPVARPRTACGCAGSTRLRSIAWRLGRPATTASHEPTTASAAAPS